MEIAISVSHHDSFQMHAPLLVIQLFNFRPQKDLQPSWFAQCALETTTVGGRLSPLVNGITWLRLPWRDL